MRRLGLLANSAVTARSYMRILTGDVRCAGLARPMHLGIDSKKCGASSSGLLPLLTHHFSAVVVAHLILASQACIPSPPPPLGLSILFLCYHLLFLPMNARGGWCALPLGMYLQRRSCRASLFRRLYERTSQPRKHTCPHSGCFTPEGTVGQTPAMCPDRVGRLEDAGKGKYTP